ncbi:MAG: GDSL-type esterase/lipase family protein [Nitrospira sp.]|nr:GDSL-type esterase/lipase family protein [Nitrospira sp.]MEB2337132.1 GDSL-type esterase/lipase family protein [Nitrospirales bacterium]QOJ34503.1 MAG: hypothetical protein HRU82_05860 [Nitrospira sp.]
MSKIVMKDKAAIVTAAIFAAGYLLLWWTGITSLGHLLDNVVGGYLLAWGLYALLSDLPRQEIRGRFVLMTGVGVTMLAVAELGGVMGLVDYQALLGTTGRAWFERPGFIRDPELTYRRQPHYREEGLFVRGNIGEALCLPPHPSQAFDLRYDHRGFRNEEDLDRADVVVIGDSYVESPMLPTSALLTTRLEQDLQRPIANLGMSGYGPEQELIVLKRYALPMQPHTIVWVYFEGNDLLQLAPEEDEEAADLLPGEGWVAHENYWMRSLTRNLLLLSRTVVRGCVPHRTYERYRGSFQPVQGQPTELFFWEKPAPLKPTDRLRLNRLRAILAEAYQLCREKGIRFVVTFAPVSYRVHRDLPNFSPLTPEMQQWPLNDLPDELRAMVRQVSPEIEFLDLTPGLREAAAAGVLTYIPDDTHWTAEGQRVAGVALSRRLSAMAASAGVGRNVSGHRLSNGDGRPLQPL